MQDFLNVTFYNNTIRNYLIFLLILAVSAAVIRIASGTFTRHLKRLADKTKSETATFLILCIRRTVKPALYIAAFCLSSRVLTLGAPLTRAIDILVLAAVLAMSAAFLSSVTAFSLHSYWRKRNLGEDNPLAVKLLTNIIKILIWAIVLVLFLDNIGLKINSLVAGLGLGGLAIAFAAQSMLQDLFCFFSIFFDKPYQLGDFITVGDTLGTVEHIGVKTTHLRSPNGELLILSNSDLANARIANYKTMEKRRVVFTIGVAYETPTEKLREIPVLIKTIIAGVKEAEFGRAHFAAYGPYSLNFEIVYYVLNGDYDQYMNINQAINFEIKEAFEKRGIVFAYPTQSIQLQTVRNEKEDLNGHG